MIIAQKQDKAEKDRMKAAEECNRAIEERSNRAARIANRGQVLEEEARKGEAQFPGSGNWTLVLFAYEKALEIFSWDMNGNDHQKKNL